MRRLVKNDNIPACMGQRQEFRSPSQITVFVINTFHSEKNKEDVSHPRSERGYRDKMFMFHFQPGKWKITLVSSVETMAWLADQPGTLESFLQRLKSYTMEVTASSLSLP